MTNAQTEPGLIEAESAVPSAEAAARAALDRVLTSEEFVSSPRLADFLRFVVETTLGGRAEEIKGYTIAVEALGRPASFDPQSDPIVRVEATRLRRALERYYNTAGPDETLEIVIPKGGYVPQFRPRGEAEEPAVAPAAPEPVAAEPPARPGWRRRLLAGTAMAGAAAVLALAWLALPLTVDNGPNSITFFFGEKASNAADLADRMGMPLLEVRPFELGGSLAPSDADVHILEVRLRDSFARFDFVDVMAAGSEAEQRECTGIPPRSVFSLGGLAEGREDGTFALLLRLSDRCGGTIIWSQAIEGLKRGPDLPESEQRVVRDVTAALMESYAVLPTRARAQARAEAPGSGFGCIALAFAVLRGEETAPPAAARACIDQYAARDNSFGILHSVKALVLLNGLTNATAQEPDPAVLEQLHYEAELGADLMPTSAYAAKALASVAFYRGEREMAISSAERAIALNPLDYDVAATAGVILIGLGQAEHGEALLNFARTHGAARTPLQDAYLGIAAFLRGDELAAASAVPQLQVHTSAQSRIALALALHVLGRDEEERKVVAALARDTPGGLAGVRRAVRNLLPVPETADPAISELEAAGLARDSIAPIVKRG